MPTISKNDSTVDIGPSEQRLNSLLILALEKLLAHECYQDIIEDCPMYLREILVQQINTYKQALDKFKPRFKIKKAL